MNARSPNFTPDRNWGDASQETRDRVARMDAELSPGGGAHKPNRPPTSFEELRVELMEPDATDGEIYQACLDAGLTVED